MRIKRHILTLQAMLRIRLPEIIFPGVDECEKIGKRAVAGTDVGVRYLGRIMDGETKSRSPSLPGENCSYYQMDKEVRTTSENMGSAL